MKDNKLEILEECIISNLNRFSINEALREYDLNIDDLEAYMNAAAAGLKQRQQAVG